LNILCVPLTCTSSPSSRPMIRRLVVWWNRRVIVYSFQSSWVFCLWILLFFPQYLFCFEPWNSVSHLFFCGEVAFNCIFYLT
jgi:hypothetical protein